MTDVADRLNDLEFQVEVSTRYHDWRRAAYERYSAFVKVLSIIGAFLAIVGALYFGDLAWLIAAGGGIIAFFNVLDLTFNFDGQARRHTELFRRFKELQSEIERRRDEAERHLPKLSAEAQAIRIDEPPTMWAVYSEAWNQAVERRGLDLKIYGRVIGPWRSFAGRVYHYHPKDFPIGSASSASG